MPRIRSASLFLVVVLAGCGTATEQAATPATTTPSTTTVTTTSTTAAAAAVRTETITTSPGITTTVFRPDGEGTAAVVLVPGGAWRSADPAPFEPMAQDLAARGVTVYLTTYHLDADRAFTEVACVVAVARQEAEAAGNGSRPVLLVGHSAGAQITATVALGGDAFEPVDGCRSDGGGEPADAWVGMSGPYEIRSIAAFGGFSSLETFMGGPPSLVEEAWDRADPYSYVDAASGLDLTMVHGRSDIVVFPLLTQRFTDALTAAGGSPVTVYIDGADHNDVYDPADAGATTIALILEAAGRVG